MSSSVAASSSASFSTTNNLISPETALQFGLSYSQGIGVAPDEAQAFSFFKLSADMGNAEAQVRTARCLEKGKGTTQNLDQALAYYEKAASQGRVKDLYDFGVRLQNEGIIKRTQKIATAATSLLAKAFTCFQKAADLGYADAQNLAGRCLEDGYGTDKNAKLAAQYYEMAVKQHHKEALCNLGQQLQGQGQYEAAFKQFFAAAQADSGNGCFMLARCYRKGLGVQKNPEQALYYYQKAATSGIKEALAEINKLSNEMHPSQPPSTICVRHISSFSSSLITTNATPSIFSSQPSQPLFPQTAANYGSSNATLPQSANDTSTVSQPLLSGTASTSSTPNATPTQPLPQPIISQTTTEASTSSQPLPPMTDSSSPTSDATLSQPSSALLQPLLQPTTTTVTLAQAPLPPTNVPSSANSDHSVNEDSDTSCCC